MRNLPTVLAVACAGRAGCLEAGWLSAAQGRLTRLARNLAFSDSELASAINTGMA